jgi:hypothetical protein
VGSTHNAGHQARREAGAQRTLYAVACMPMLDKALAEMMRHPHAVQHWTTPTVS